MGLGLGVGVAPRTWTWIRVVGVMGLMGVIGVVGGVLVTGVMVQLSAIVPSHLNDLQGALLNITHGPTI